MNSDKGSQPDKAIRRILTENYRRLARFSAPFNPITGEGSVGERVRVEIPDFVVPLQWLPVDMLHIPFVSRLVRAGSIEAFLNDIYTEKARKNLACSAHGSIDAKSLSRCVNALRQNFEDDFHKISRAFIRIRCRHDFPFWAAYLVKIKNKEAGDDVRFRLRYPQRILVSKFEEKRRAGKPIRLILLKARQWGGSTTTQLYMAWLQFFHKRGLNSLIIAQQGSASDEIKDMFDRMISAYPVEMLHEPGESYSDNEPKLVGVGKSGSTHRVPQRNCKIKIGTAERPDGCRGGDYSLVHLSEVGIWKKTEGKSPEDIVRSACSGILLRPLTMIVMESTANGTGNFFHSEYVAAADPATPSQFDALFIAWFQIEQYSLPFDSHREKVEFARSLFEGRLRENVLSSRQESGRYLWWLWEKGATLEAINWYIHERAGKNDHAVMASEFPSDDIEAFVHSGSMVFDRYLVREFEDACRPPRFVGEICGDAADGKFALSGLRFSPDTQGLLSVWSLPDSVEKSPDSGSFVSLCNPSANNPPSHLSRCVSRQANLASLLEPSGEFVANRYLCVVDVGGRSSKSDWSVVVVFDRLDMIDGDRPEVVAQWYGHCDIDCLAWKAAQIAAFYDNALLVIESNTLETRDRERQLEGGDQSLYILNQIAAFYPNLYARRQSDDEIRSHAPRKYGFHTNVSTKPMVISTLVKIVREHLYTERDRRCLDEFLTYERRPNGSYGAIVGRHDDLLMTRAIGLHICFYEMDPPRLVTRQPRRLSKRSGPVSEAAF